MALAGPCPATQSQGIITRDNVSVDVSAVAYYKVVDAVKSVGAIENVGEAIDQIAQTTLRKVVGQHSLDQTLAAGPLRGLAQDPPQPGRAPFGGMAVAGRTVTAAHCLGEPGPRGELAGRAEPAAEGLFGTSPSTQAPACLPMLGSPLWPSTRWGVASDTDAVMVVL